MIGAIGISVLEESIYAHQDVISTTPVKFKALGRAMDEDHSLELSANTFGMLVKSFRGQRKWSQAQLAKKWNHTREYVSLIERGERKLDKQEQVSHLVDILGISLDQFDAIGEDILQHRTIAEKLPEADDILFQALLEPSRTTVKLSWLLWLADSQRIPITQNLANLTIQLEDAMTKYRGQFLKPAQKVLAYVQEMQGKIAFDQLKFTDANRHFQEMLDLGEELGDPNIISLAQIHRADIIRKRGRYDTAVRMLDALSKNIHQAEDYIRGHYYQVLARAHYSYGYEQLFLDAIDHATGIAENIKETVDSQYNQFNKTEVLQERAQGLTMLWQPEKALTIYHETDKLNPFRPIRARGSYLIIKAQAYAYSGDMNTGIDLALQGISLARDYGSPRHISRVQGMYDRLSVTALGKHVLMKDLKDALRSE